MTFEAALALVDKVTIGWPYKAFGAAIGRRVLKTDAGRVLELRASFDEGAALDRETGQPLTRGLLIMTGISEQAISQMSETAFLREVKTAMAKLVLHELDESFLVDGVRVFDPHVPKPG